MFVWTATCYQTYCKPVFIPTVLYLMHLAFIVPLLKKVLVDTEVVFKNLHTAPKLTY